MGMFDSIYAEGVEYQTKALANVLYRFRLGERLLSAGSCDIEVLGPQGKAYAQVRDGILVAIAQEADPSLVILDYHGGPANIIFARERPSYGLIP